MGFYIYLGFLLVSMAIVIFLAAFTLSRTDSRKIIWFTPMLVAMFFYLLGIFMSVISKSAEAAYNGVRLELVGSYTIGPLTMFFIADYCKIKIHRAFKAVLLLISLILLVFAWTTEFHGLIYTSFTLSEKIYDGIDIESGPMRFFTHLYILFCTVMASIFLVKRMFNWGAKYHRILVLFIFALLTPALVNILYSMNIWGLADKGMQLPAIIMSFNCIILWLNVVRYNMFDIVTEAMKMALMHTKEAFILIDVENNFLHANEAAVKVFPELETMRTNSPIDRIENLPFTLPGNAAVSERLYFEQPGDRYFSASIDPIKGENAKIEGHIILIQDISEVTLLAKKAEEANRLKSNFLQDMSHEMKNPLTVIATGIDYADSQTGIKEANIPKAKEAIETVRNETQRLGRMVGGMIDLASISGTEENRKRINFAELLTSSAEVFRFNLEQKNISLHVEIAPGLPDVFIESDKFKQVLFNLLSNAADHTQDGRITVMADSLDGYITVRVTDTGSGISPDLIPRLFERGISGRGGTGYGLFLCKIIIEAHGGKINIESEPGKGTDITFTIPVYGGQEVAHRNERKNSITC